MVADDDDDDEVEISEGDDDDDDDEVEISEGDDVHDEVEIDKVLIIATNEFYFIYQFIKNF